MAIIDFLILIPLAWGAYRGFRRGLIMELILILAFLLGITLGFLLMDWVVGLIEPNISDKSVVPYVAFITIFIVVVIGVILLGKVLRKVLKITLLGWVDKIGGAIFGAVKWLVIISLGFFVTQRAGLELPEEMTKDALIFPFVLSSGPWLVNGLASIFPLSKDLMASVAEKLK